MMATTSQNTPALLLLGNYRPSLTLARTFNQRGFRVIVGSQGYESICQYSNAVAKMWNHSPLGSGPQKFIRDLRRFTEQNPELSAIYLVAEEYVRFYAANPDAFDDLPPVISVNPDLVNKCLDKSFMMNLADKVEVPVAPFAVSSNPVEFDQAVEQLGFPVLVRPLNTETRFEGRKTLSFHSDDEVAEYRERHQFDNIELLTQRKFYGKRYNIYFASIDGELTRCLQAIIDHTDNPDGSGLAIEGHTIEADGPLIEQTCKLLRELDYTGIGCAQFLVNEDTGETSFLEINPRIAGNHALPEYAGLDLGQFLFNLGLGEPIDPSPVHGASGIRYSWTIGALMGAKDAYMRGQIGATSALGLCFRAIIRVFNTDVHMVFDRLDPKPSFAAMWKIVPRFARWKNTTDKDEIHSTYEIREGVKNEH